MTNHTDHGHWVASNSGPDRWVAGPKGNELYQREVARTMETADKIRRDAGEALGAGVIDQETHDRLVASAQEYADSTVKLLRVVYLGQDS